MKRISSKLNRVKIKKSQLQNTANNMNAQDEQSISAEDYQWELMAQEAFERSYYLHLGYNNY